MVRGFVEAMGGDGPIESAPGKGATVKVDLPIEIVARAAPRAWTRTSPRCSSVLSARGCRRPRRHERGVYRWVQTAVVPERPQDHVPSRIGRNFAGTPPLKNSVHSSSGTFSNTAVLSAISVRVRNPSLHVSSSDGAGGQIGRQDDVHPPGASATAWCATSSVGALVERAVQRPAASIVPERRIMLTVQPCGTCSSVARPFFTTALNVPSWHSRTSAVTQRIGDGDLEGRGLGGQRERPGQHGPSRPSLFRTIGGRVLDLDAALAFLGGPLPAGPWPEGAPPHELLRSPAAARVGRLAAEAGFFLLHHEHRLAEVDAEPAEWTDGVLPEPKYEAFRHDLPIGSFHPGHRAKWTAHELCHLLVGFGWRPGATPLFTATAARLAELVPVVLWYFLDEVRLRRCPRHDGPLFRTFCADCEAAAAGGSRAARRGARPPSPRRRRPLRRGRARGGRAHAEARTALSARLGLAGSHVGRPRVRGGAPAPPDRAGLRGARRALPRTASRPGRARSETSRDAPSPCSARSPKGGRWRSAGDRGRWVARDLCQRLLEIRDETDGDCARELLGVVDALAAGGAPRHAFAACTALFDEYELPLPEDVFAVGYALDGVPSRAVAQVEDGLRTVVPLALELAEDADVDVVAPFVEADAHVRRPLGQRFADWLAVAHPEVAPLARFEAALQVGAERARGRSSAPARAPARGRRRRGAGPHDVVALAHAVQVGETTGGAGREARPPAVSAADAALAVARSAEGPVVVEVTAIERLADPASSPDCYALQAVGMLVPARWPA